MSNCVFCRIVKKEIPAQVLFEDDICLAFEDINPKAPTHSLIITKAHIESVETLQDPEAPALGHLFLVARDLARQKGIHQTGYRTVINTGPQAGQSVHHIHLHLMGGRRMGWPPG
ncbi:MAG TPA: histidine triad nucleotide-binding protein [Terriglobia bacterium]|nr:histidine triad nucleotide-binding protein [Terriglobia bacterium]